MKIAVFYHCVLSGPRIPDPDHAFHVMHSQMAALKASGLADEAEEFHIGVNGSSGDCLEVLAVAPSQFCVPHCHHFPEGQSELTTLSVLHSWLKDHPVGWKVLYHHTKGVSKRGDTDSSWRQRMEQACVWRWRECVKALDQGYNTAGTQWITPFPGKTFPPGQRYWAGNFWWATSEYLMTLAPLVEPQYVNRTEWENRYEAEVWIGKSIQPPMFYDLKCP